MSEIASLRETSEVILVRHGEDTDNKNGILNGHRDNNLTNRGIKQALEVGKELRSYDPDIVFSSPLKRAKHT
ncbi:MAG: histidine phosphatase family protein, partial [Candidatus Magasanikbacteria bacterium]